MKNDLAADLKEKYGLECLVDSVYLGVIFLGDEDEVIELSRLLGDQKAIFGQTMTGDLHYVRFPNWFKDK